MSNIENKGMEKPKANPEKKPSQFVQEERKALETEDKETPQQSGLKKVAETITKFVTEEVTSQQEAE